MLRKILAIGFFTYCIFLSSILNAKDTIMVSIPPQKFFVEQIVKDKFNVKALMDDHIFSSPYKPSAQQYIWSEDAKIFFTIGLDEEKKWIQNIKINNPSIKIFSTIENIKLIKNDNHVWLDPFKVRIQAKNMLKEIIKLDKINAKFYQKNYLLFVNKISSLDYQIKSIFRKHKMDNFMTFNPAWSYFAKRYKIKQIEIEANILSTKKQNSIQIINQINRYRSNILFIPEYYFPKKILHNINLASKITIVKMSPLRYNWSENLLNFAKIIAFQPR